MHIAHGRSVPSHITAGAVHTALDRHRERLGASIAAAFLDGPWDPGPMAERAAHDLGVPIADWICELAVIAFAGYSPRPADRPRELRAFVAACEPFSRHLAGIGEESAEHAPHPRRALVATEMGPTRWPVLRLDSVGDLAEMLGLHPSTLAWYADVRSLERTAASQSLRHYHYRWVPKASGGSRLLEAPKGTLKFFQRRILADVLAPIPPHPASHGFQAGRSVHTFVRAHVGQRVVIRIDLESFFASVTAGAVFGIVRSAGYPEPVAHCLTGLMTNAVPAAVLRTCPLPAVERRPAHRRMLAALGHPHLPQGAPTSPALANLATFGLDCRLDGLARRFGAKYTRYADDLAFSGDEEVRRRSIRLISLVTEISRSEGFHVNPLKTRVATQSSRQTLGGLVVNETTNVPRGDFDRLKAVLHDAVLHGPIAANRQHHEHFKTHLLGRISWVESANPRRAARLRTLFDRIAW